MSTMAIVEKNSDYEVDQSLVEKIYVDGDTLPDSDDLKNNRFDEGGNLPGINGPAGDITPGGDINIPGGDVVGDILGEFSSDEGMDIPGTDKGNGYLNGYGGVVPVGTPNLPGELKPDENTGAPVGDGLGVAPGTPGGEPPAAEGGMLTPGETFNGFDWTAFKGNGVTGAPHDGGFDLPETPKSPDLEPQEFGGNEYQPMPEFNFGSGVPNVGDDIEKGVDQSGPGAPEGGGAPIPEESKLPKDGGEGGFGDTTPDDTHFNPSPGPNGGGMSDNQEVVIKAGDDCGDDKCGKEGDDVKVTQVVKYPFPKKSWNGDKEWDKFQKEGGIWRSSDGKEVQFKTHKAVQDGKDPENALTTTLFEAANGQNYTVTTGGGEEVIFTGKREGDFIIVKVLNPVVEKTFDHPDAEGHAADGKSKEDAENDVQDFLGESDPLLNIVDEFDFSGGAPNQPTDPNNLVSLYDPDDTQPTHLPSERELEALDDPLIQPTSFSDDML